jgi:hypothetical protein
LLIVAFSRKDVHIAVPRKGNVNQSARKHPYTNFAAGRAARCAERS